MPDLAFTKEDLAERQAEYSATPPVEDMPKYPWGLELCFDKTVLAKLGLQASDFKMGQEIPVQAVLRVRSLRQEENVSGEDSSVGLTMISVDLPKTSKAQAKKLYPDQAEAE